MDSVLSAAKDVALILRGEREKTRTMVSYSKLLAAQAARGAGISRAQQPRRLQLCGLSIEYLDLVSLTHMFREIYVENHYAFDAGRDDPQVVDAGANIGLATLFVKQLYPRARILAFEPEPTAFAVFERNMRANGIEGVTAINKALAGRSGAAVLFGNPSSLVCSLSGGRRSASEPRSIEAVRLSPFIEDEVDFLKLDIEGMELEVLTELATSGKLGLIRQLVCEYHHHLQQADDALARFLELLEDAGFGYQLVAALGMPFRQDVFQDVLVFGYRKSAQPTS